MNAKTRSLIHFLHTELAIPTEAIALALQQCEQTPTLIPIILWQYGLVTLAQLDQILDWLEQHSTLSQGIRR
jgi:hypothetical protein